MLCTITVTRRTSEILTIPLTPRMQNVTTLWNEVCQLEGDPLNQIKSVYDARTFPIEFRHYFCQIIEHERWDQIDPDDPHHERAARGKYKTPKRPDIFRTTRLMMVPKSLMYFQKCLNIG